MKSDPQIEKAIRLLNQDSSHKLGEVASHCRLSISRLSHLFRSKIGVSMGKYRRNRRFEEAKRMLATTDMSIKEIAYTLGYRHTSSFVRAFERCAGIAPGAYRSYQIQNSVSAITANKEQEKLTTFY